MRVRVCERVEEVALAGADRLEHAVSRNARLVLGLPTGRTMVQFYAELARRHRSGRLDLRHATGFNLDELVLPPGHPDSFRGYMERHAGARIGLEPLRSEIPRTDGDLEAECRRYDAALAAAGGLDLAVLGLGADGHVAYNLPGPPRDESHVVTLPDALADALGLPEEWRPLRAITMGLGNLRGARSLLVLATGATKAAAVRALREGPRHPAWPCSLLRDHAELELVVDRAAAAELQS
ncbi:MAG TPA: 6-phosphogluconolactonase [Thermoanaerobaculia bacterium]|nr:6-phosphogluconolactonase [Thermoanaerobaculia bacterium]